MTPIKYVLVLGMAAFCVDFADHRNHVATATTPENARWLAESLGMAHNVDAFVQASDTEARRRVWPAPGGELEEDPGPPADR